MEMEPERGLLFAVLSFSGRNFEDVEVDELNAAGGGDLVRDEVGGGVCPGDVTWPVYKGNKYLKSFVLRKTKDIPTSHPEGA